MYVLEAGVLAMVAREIKPAESQRYMADFFLQLNKAAGFDKKTPEPLLLSRGVATKRGNSWTW